MMKNYNPDVLSCLANLSNDEVFTPPSIVNDMLDLLPENLWSDKTVTFLNPFTKSGVFLREIAKRLMKGLKDEIPDQQERANHIFKNQLFGIAITELTSLLARRSIYCSKYANGEYSIVSNFENKEGNIIYKRIEHDWHKGKCVFCGANESAYDRDKSLETHAYHFIHTNNPKTIFDMNFDVIIGNPPYQLSDGGHSRSSSPIYQLFVEQAMKMNPKYLSMIIPARWYAGGKGLDTFRSSMLGDSRLRKIVDFENSKEVFPGVDVAGGICYFLWERDNKGKCEMSNMYNGERITTVRKLNEFNILIRHGKAVPIIKKIKKTEKPEKFLNSVISKSRPFGLRGNHRPSEKGVPCFFTQRQGVKFVNKSEINDSDAIMNKWKLLIPRAPIAGQTDFSKPVGFYYDGNVRIARPGEICTESWLVAYSSATKKEVLSFKSYLFTKIVRFLLLQTVVSQDVTRERFAFIPFLPEYNKNYDDTNLRKRWKITDKEWEFIDSKIK